MNLIRFVDVDGTACYVNKDKIAEIYENTTRTATVIVFDGGAFVRVTENLDEVYQKLIVD